MERRTPMKRQPMKRRPPRPARDGEVEREFRGDERVAIERRSDGKCEARTPHCTDKARIIHHRLLKRHGGRGDRGNGLHCCTACHLFIHMHPEESYEKGWMIRGVVGTVE